MDGEKPAGKQTCVVEDSLRGSSVESGTGQGILAWPLRKDDTHNVAWPLRKDDTHKSRSLSDASLSCARPVHISHRPIHFEHTCGVVMYTLSDLMRLWISTK